MALLVRGRSAEDDAARPKPGPLVIYGTYLSASGMAQATAEQDVIANNLANAETTGFKRLLTAFRQRDPQPDAPDPLRRMTGGNVMLPSRVDVTPGTLDQTNNPLDVAILGNGFFEVSHADGQTGGTFLARDGRLALNATGHLTLASDPNTRLLDAQGRPIQMPNGTQAGDVSIESNGDVVDRRTGTIAGRLRLALPQDNSSLAPVGGGLMSYGGTLRDAPETSVRLERGFVETSNVDPTRELTRLIEVGRLLETHANLIQHQDTALGKLIEASSIS